MIQYSQKRKNFLLGLGSFLIPILIWSCVSYLPFIWHPQVQITDSGSVSYLQVGTRIEKTAFYRERNRQWMQVKHRQMGFWSIQFICLHHMRLPKRWSHPLPHHHNKPDAPWLHQSPQRHSIKIVFIAFFISSLIGIPLGILSGFSATISRLTEPFVEFFRYLPAPAFGALAVPFWALMMHLKLPLS